MPDRNYETPLIRSDEPLRVGDQAHFHFDEFAVTLARVDFYCAEIKLVVEIDGGVHRQQVAADRERTNILEQKGYHVIRFSNHQVENELVDVLAAIYYASQTGSRTPLPSLGEGQG